MEVVVLVKPTPDIEKVSFDLSRGVVARESAELEINPFDLHAIEAAVRIKEVMGGKVTAVSMSPPHGERALRDAIARGVDRAILISDRRLAGSDTLATSYVLASAIRKLGNFDLVICGEKSVDGDTGQVGPEVAEFLGIPHASFVTELRSVSKEYIEVIADLGPAYYEVRLRLPALITVTKEVNTPRKPRFRDLMRARRAHIEVWDLSMLKDYVSPDNVGLKGSATRVIKSRYALERGRKCLTVKGVEGVSEAIRILRDEGIL